MGSTVTTKIFADRLLDLITETGKTIKQLSEEIGISSGSLSKYQNDGAVAGIDAISKIAKYFNVSVDWLLGHSSTRSPNATLQGACAYTGLSEKAIDYFHAWTMPDLETGPSYLSFLSQLIESAEFDTFVDNLCQYYYAVAAKQLLSMFPNDRKKSVQMTLHKMTRGNNYVKSPQLREKLEEYCEFLWNSNREAYALDVPDVYEYHVSQALSALLRAEQDIAQAQAIDMLPDTIDNILKQIDGESIGPEGENFIDERLRQVLQGLSF